MTIIGSLETDGRFFRWPPATGCAEFATRLLISLELITLSEGCCYCY